MNAMHHTNIACSNSKDSARKFGKVAMHKHMSMPCAMRGKYDTNPRWRIVSLMHAQPFGEVQVLAVIHGDFDQRGLVEVEGAFEDRQEVGGGVHTEGGQAE